MTGFDGNDYRKRVLAAIETRGGVPTSDPFEWYDVALEDAETVQDATVTEQVAAVWAFWQKQRDHPKYRGLVTALLAVHPEVSPELCERGSRGRLAHQIRASRAQRDEERFAELDGAIERLVERFGGIPRTKLDGLRAFARQAGNLDAQSVEARLAAHPVVDDEPVESRPASATVSPAVYRQVRADLDELGRILGRSAPASLYDLLGLEPGASYAELSRERDLAAARNRELRPDRRRALVDDLLAAVTTLLLENDPEVYLDVVAEEVTERLRSRVAAAVLVEDEFTAADYGHLLSEAEACGLDRGRAVRVLSTLAQELGVAVPRVPAADRGRRSASAAPSTASASSLPTPTRSGSSSHETLSQARAALRAGRVLEAQRLVTQARQLAGGTLPPIRAVSDEIAEVLAEAHQRWRAALQALTALRFTEAGTTLHRLQKIAADLPGPSGQSVADALKEADQGSSAATAALAATDSLVGDARELALLNALRSAPDHPGLLTALQTIGVQPAQNVRTRIVAGFVEVSWTRSSSPGTIDYRVEHITADGRRRAFGSTQSTALEAAVPSDGGPLSRYAVVARRAGISSVEALSAGSGSPAVPPAARATAGAVPPATAPPAVPSLALLPHGRRVRLVYPAPARGQAEVRRLPAGASPPVPGSVVSDPAAFGAVVPGMGPGLAVDSRPNSPTGYVVFAIDGVTVAGASTWYVDLPPVHGLHQAEDRLRWDWPAGCTEVVVTWRTDAPPERADDPAATSRKLTNTRYQIDGGFVLPVENPLHVAVFACTRLAGALVTATEAPLSARLAPPA
jgi:hypothetical protein